MLAVQRRGSEERLVQKELPEAGFERTTSLSEKASSPSSPVHDTIASRAEVVAGEDSDLIYIGTFKKAFQGVEKFFNATVKFFCDSESEDDDIEEKKEPTQLAVVKNEEDKQQLASNDVEGEFAQQEPLVKKMKKAKVNVAQEMPIEVVAPSDLIHRVMTQLGKSDESIIELYSDQIIASYLSFMNGPTFRTRRGLSKEDRAVQYAADSLSQILKQVARRVKMEKVE